MRATFAAVVATLALAGAVKYPNEHLPHGNTTVFAIADNKYGRIIFARGKDGHLYQRYMYGNMTDFSDWNLMPHAPSGVWDSDPAVGVNFDGRVECFIRWSTNLDLWQYYQEDPTDPMSWTTPREASCVDMDICNNKTVNPPEKFFVGQPIFPTSDVTVLRNHVSGALSLYYRGFDGRMYSTTQREAGNGFKYTPPMPLGEAIWE